MAEQILIEPAHDMDAVRQLWAQYWDEHHEDLGAQDLAAEAKELPRGYEQPDGGLLVARHGGEVVGTVGYQRIDDVTADMKRMYVPFSHRGKGIGEALVQGVMSMAAGKGFRRMILDVGASQVAARRIYEEAGFKDEPGMMGSPLKGGRYMSRELSS